MLKDSQNDKFNYEYKDSDRGGLLDTQTYEHTLTHRQADRHTDTQTHRHTDKQIDRQVARQADMQ